MATRFVSWLAAAVACSLLPSLATAIGIEDIVNGGNNYNWQRVELPGTVCSNGSQYKFFTSTTTPGSNDLLILYFEGGGACWDYESCSGAARACSVPRTRTASPDDYVTQLQPRPTSRRS